jgi:hypothetical protein
VVGAGAGAGDRLGWGAAPPGPLVLDLDATLVDAHSDKQGAAPTYKHSFGFIRCWPTWTAVTAPGRR